MAEQTTVSKTQRDTAGNVKTSVRTFSAGVRQIAGHARAAAEAQMTIWSMKATRLVALAAFAVFGGVLWLALTMYGFTLLDAALAAWLSHFDLPAWCSPLIRGGAYFLAPILLALAGWHILVGYGRSEPPAPKDDAARHA